MAWKSVAVPLVWYAGVVVPIFKKDNQRECFSYRGITLVSLPGKVQVRILVRRDIQLVKPQFQEEKFGGFVLVAEYWTRSLSSRGYLRVHGSLRNYSLFAFWTWRRHFTKFLCKFGYDLLSYCYESYSVSAQLNFEAHLSSRSWCQNLISAF